MGCPQNPLLYLQETAILSREQEMDQEQVELLCQIAGRLTVAFSHPINHQYLPHLSRLQNLFHIRVTSYFLLRVQLHYPPPPPSLQHEAHLQVM